MPAGTPRSAASGGDEPAADQAWVLVEPAAFGQPTVLYWHGARLGFIEHHVDGWHGYVHPLLDPARARHCGHRAHYTAAAALHAIVSSVGGSSGDVTLTPVGLRCRGLSARCRQ